MKHPSPAETSDLLLATAAGSTVFLVGVGGCGMSGLAHLLLDLGHRVVGSDLSINHEIRELRARGADIESGHSAERLRKSQPVLVVYSSAIRLDNPEIEAAQELNLPIIRRAVLLAGLLGRQTGVCVAGMHGKTTTTSLLTFALDRLENFPSYAIGAKVPQLSRHARFSKSIPGEKTPLFVVEADESDGTLREFRPEHAIVLNVDEEHLDFFANLDGVCREFKQFGEQTRGIIVFCADDPYLAELFIRRPGAVSFGFHPLATYRVQLGGESTARSPRTSFTVWHRGSVLGEFHFSLMGEKNISNAAAVIALLHQLGFAPEQIGAAISDFRGAARRQQELFGDHRFRVFDDYGHHPAEIEATLSAFRAQSPRRIVVAFQPHRFTRTLALAKQFASCFKQADKLWLTEIYAASEEPIPGVSSSMLAEQIRARGQNVAVAPDLEILKAEMRKSLEPGDIVLFLGAGDITHAAQSFAAQLQNEMATPLEDFVASLAARLSSAAVLRRNEPLAKRTTLRVGGTADVYVEPASENDLAEVLRQCQSAGIPFFILGRGSNLLIRDRGIRGVVICLAHASFSKVEIIGDHVHCGAGAKLKTISVEARRNGIAGMEFLEGIPGSVGGALRMNAGAMGGWTFEVVETLRFMDYAGNVSERAASEVNVEYRGCPLLKTHIALSAVLKGQVTDRSAIEARATAYNEKRWSSQPAAPSAGCIFKNPTSIGAGKLIDELGLKGTRVGGALVSDVHGNFIVNDGSATARDVLGLIDIIKARAREARGIELHTEVEIVGE